MRYFKHGVKTEYIRKKGIRCCGLILAVMLCVMSVPGRADATEETKQKLKEAQQKREQTQSTLDNQKSNINQMNSQKDSLQGQR
jgi:hypothetical protein